MTEIIIAVILFLIAALAFVFSFRSFREKGFLPNNAYLYASKKERETMNKKPYYWQTAIIFLLIAFVFLLNGLSVLLKANWISFIAGAVIAVALIYAIASSIAIEKHKKK